MEKVRGCRSIPVRLVSGGVVGTSFSGNEAHGRGWRMKALNKLLSMVLKVRPKLYLSLWIFFNM